MEYIKDYSQLEPFDSKSQLFPLMVNTSTGLIESKDPSELCIHITNLRRMKKYEKTLFEHTFNNIINKFNRIILNEHKSVCLNALTLISELFSVLDPESMIIGWFEVLLTAVFEQSINQDKDINNMAIICLNNCVDNMWYTENMDCLIDLLILNSSNEVTQNIFVTMVGIVKCIDKENLIFTFHWEGIMDTIESGWSNGDDYAKNNIREFLKVIQAKLEGEFSSLLNVMRPEQAELYLKIIN
jgi:hypothetical protein